MRLMLLTEQPPAKSGCWQNVKSEILLYTSSNLLSCLSACCQCPPCSTVYFVGCTCYLTCHMCYLKCITYSSWQIHQGDEGVHLFFYHFIEKSVLFMYFFLLMWTYFKICSACVRQLVPISLFTGSTESCCVQEHQRTCRELLYAFRSFWRSCNVMPSTWIKILFNIPMAA